MKDCFWSEAKSPSWSPLPVLPSRQSFPNTAARGRRLNHESERVTPLPQSLQWLSISARKSHGPQDHVAAPAASLSTYLPLSPLLPPLQPLAWLLLFEHTTCDPALRICCQKSSSPTYSHALFLYLHQIFAEKSPAQ